MATDLLPGTGEKGQTSLTKKGQLYSLNGDRYQKYLDGYFTFFAVTDRTDCGLNFVRVILTSTRVAFSRMTSL